MRRGHRVDRHKPLEPWSVVRHGLTRDDRAAGLLEFVALLRESLASSRLPAPYRVPLDSAAGGGRPSTRPMLVAQPMFGWVMSLAGYVVVVPPRCLTSTDSTSSGRPRAK